MKAEDRGDGRNTPEGRGVKYPGDDLGAAIEMLAKVRGAVGLSAASRETVVNALGYQTINGASARKLAALSHFGLVDRAGTGALRISELGRRILMPTSEADRRAAIFEAALAPSLFRQVFERFAGQAIPGLLSNLLVREFGVFHGSSEAAAKTFRDSVEHAGLIRNGILVDPNTDVPNSDEVDGSTKPPGTKPEVDDAPHPRNPEVPIPAAGTSGTTRSPGPMEGDQRYVVALGGDGRVAHIDIPVPVSLKDLRRVQLWATYMEGVLAEEFIE